MTKLSPQSAALLQELPLFGVLNASAFQQICAATSEIDAPRGTILRRRGERCSSMGIVAEGRVKLSLVTKRGIEKIIALLGPRGRFSDGLLFSGETSLATVEALSNSRILNIDKKALLREIRGNPDFAQLYIEDLSRRLCQRVKDIESYTVLSGTERLIDYLLSEEPESAVNGVRHVILERKGVIASRLNLTHEHFSRILYDLASRKLIEVHGAHLLIPDVQALKNTRA